MNQQQGAKPYKVDHKDPVRTFEIIDKEGNVKMHEITESEVYFSAREFLTFKREFDKMLEQHNEMLTEDYKEKIEKKIEKVKAELVKVGPVSEESDKLAIVHSKKLAKEQHIESFKKGLEKDLIGTHNAKMAWDQLDEEQKKQLTDEERKKVLDLIAKAKRK